MQSTPSPNGLTSEATEWIETELQKLDLAGRDPFYTDLITQEIPFWLSTIKEGKKVEEGEVEWLVRRRGFNPDEATKFRALASFFNTRSTEIHARFAPAPSRL